MSGFYQNWLKVQNPNMSNNIIPMESGGYQQPFFFGGSQVPSSIGLKNTEITGEGIRGYSKVNFLPEVRGKGITPTQNYKHSNIIIPRHIGSLKRGF
jgi:hypothetical protein